MDEYGNSTSAGTPADTRALLARVRDLEQALYATEAAQRALVQREQETRDFLDHAPHALHSVGPDGRILWANQAELDLLGYAYAEYVGHHVAEFHVHAEGVQGLLARLVAGEPVRDFPAQLRARSGAVRHVVISCNARWENGRFLYSRCFTRDVTAEYERDAAMNEAFQARARLAAIVDSSDDAIVSKTIDGIITSWNAGAQRLYGYAPQEAIGQSIALIVPPDLWEEEQQILRKLARGERVEHFETERVARDGRRVPVSLTISPVRDAQGRIVGASKIARDITERRRAMQRLREEHRRKDEFLAMLGHELRNPLAPIQMAAEVLRRTIGDAPEMQRLCAVLDRQVGHMTRLLDDLLDVSRITQGKIQFLSEPVDLRQVVARALETSRPLIDARGHELELALTPHPVLVRGDLTRLTQMLSNLLNNAAKYTNPGGRIALALRSAGDRAEIAVRDNGVGIGPDVLPHVFDVFVQAERTLDRAQGGLGLGLTLVRSIVEAHGGRIVARSAGVGRGSEFVVELAQIAQDSAPPRPALAAPEANAGGRRVVVVDDNVDSAHTLADFVRLGGYDVSTITDSTDVVERLSALAPDAVLLDIGLPGANGYEIAAALRARGSAALLVAVTGYGQPEDRERSRTAGFDAHCVKPVDPETIQRLLAQGRGAHGPEGMRPKS